MNGSLTLIYSCAGFSGTAHKLRTADGAAIHEIALNPAVAGTLTTRTDNDTGTITMAEGHGFLNDDIVDVYWSGGVRYGMTVSSQGATTMVVGAVGIGAGDNLPAEGTALTVAKQQEVTLNIHGDSLEMFVIHATGRAHLDIQDAGGSELVVEIPAPSGTTEGEFYVWSTDSGFVNPIASDTIIKALVSTAETAAKTLKIVALKDTTP